MAVSPMPRGRGTTNPRNVVVEYTRSIVDRAIERPDRVSISEIVDQVMEKFGTDQTFLMNLAMMNVRELVQAAVRETVADTRRASPFGQRRVIVGDHVLSEQEHLAQAPALMQALAIRWGRFREWDGQHQILLVKMNRPELLTAARIRRERAQHELEYAILLERLAAKLPDDTTLVEVIFPPDQIEVEYIAAQEQAQKEVGAEDVTPSGD